MVEKRLKKTHMPHEFEQPLLSTDLDWMLLSSQVGSESIIEAVVREYGTTLIHLVSIYFGNERESREVVEETMISVITNRHRYRSQQGVRPWLFRLLFERCMQWANKRRAGDVDKNPWQVVSEREAELWHILQVGDSSTRIAMSLYYLYGVPKSEIAYILGVNEDNFERKLGNDRGEILAYHPSEPNGKPDTDDWLVESLKRLWPSPILHASEEDIIISAALQRFDRKQQRNHTRALFKQGFFSAAILLIIALVGWVSNQVFFVKPRVRQDSPATSTARVLETPGLLISLEKLSTTPIEPTVRRRTPLNIDSTEDEIRTRLYESRGIWDQVRLDALLIRYDPADNGRAPSIYRNQIWLRNPRVETPVDYWLVLAGAPNGEPLFAQYLQGRSVSEIDLKNGLIFKYEMGDHNPIYDSLHPVYLGMYGFGEEGILNGSYLTSMVYGAGLVSLPGNLHGLRTETLLKRRVLVVENRLMDGFFERMWIDSQTGMVFRWQGFNEGENPRLNAEMIITDLEFGAGMPDNLLAAAASWRKTTGAGESADSQTTGGRPIAESDQKTATGPNASCLLFQWPGAKGSISTDQSLVSILAGGALIGETSLGVPWQVECERSLDGNHIACLDHPPGLAGIFSAGSRLYSFSVSNPADIHPVFSTRQGESGDFAFSPDGAHLAFWGCESASSGCGIYLQDAQTGVTEKKLSSVESSGLITWSKDGRYLAFIEAGFSHQDAKDLRVIDLLREESIYSGPFRWLDAGIPPEVPFGEWASDFTTPRFSFEQCDPPGM